MNTSEYNTKKRLPRIINWLLIWKCDKNRNRWTRINYDGIYIYFLSLQISVWNRLWFIAWSLIGVFSLDDSCYRVESQQQSSGRGGGGGRVAAAAVLLLRLLHLWSSLLSTVYPIKRPEWTLWKPHFKIKETIIHFQTDLERLLKCAARFFSSLKYTVFNLEL